MKKTHLFIILGLFFLLVNQVQAQKFGYIDSEYITSKMPSFKQVEAEMNTLSEKWVQEIKSKNDALNDMYRKFQAEEALLTEEMKRERQKQILAKEEEVEVLNNKVFGLEGILFQKKKDLMKPLQDEIFRAVEKVAKKRQLMFLFDKSADMTMIYTDPRHDYTDYVLEELGLSDDRNKAKK